MCLLAQGVGGGWLFGVCVCVCVYVNVVDVVDVVRVMCASSKPAYFTPLPHLPTTLCATVQPNRFAWLVWSLFHLPATVLVFDAVSCEGGFLHGTHATFGNQGLVCGWDWAWPTSNEGTDPLCGVFAWV